MRADLGAEHYFLDFLRLSIVIWPHATSSSIETVCANWRILACITTTLNMDMAMPKKWVTSSTRCISNSKLWLLLNFLLPTTSCKFMAVLCLPRAAYQWSGQRLRFSMEILQNFPAKVMCMFFFRSNYKMFCLFVCLFYGEKIRFPRETTTTTIGFQFPEWHAVCKKLLRPIPGWTIYLWSENFNNNRARCLALIWRRHQRNLPVKVGFHGSDLFVLLSFIQLFKLSCRFYSHTLIDLNFS